MSRRGENIYKRRDGRYEGRYVKGKKKDGTTQYGYIYGRQYGEVKRLLNQIKSDLMKSSQSNVCMVSFTEWVKRWQILKLRCRVKESTQQTYNLILRRYIIPIIGNIDLSEITPEKVVDMLTQLTNCGYSERTKGMVLYLLSSIMNAAVENDLIKRNPCKKIGIVKSNRCRDQHVLTKEEQMVLEEGDELSILIALYTGMRIGEICGLKWSDINWEANTISVNRTVQRVRQPDGKTRLIESTPKTINSYRVIPLADKLRKELELHTKGNNGYILGKDGHACDPRTLQRKLKAIAERAGLSNIHFHSLRHTFATRMLAIGIDVKTVSMLLGHSSVNTTLNIYMHSNMDLKREAIRKLSATR